MSAPAYRCGSSSRATRPGSDTTPPGRAGRRTAPAGRGAAPHRAPPGAPVRRPRRGRARGGWRAAGARAACGRPAASPTRADAVAGPAAGGRPGAAQWSTSMPFESTVTCPASPTTAAAARRRPRRRRSWRCPARPRPGRTPRAAGPVPARRACSARSSSWAAPGRWSPGRRPPRTGSPPPCARARRRTRPATAPPQLGRGERVDRQLERQPQRQPVDGDAVDLVTTPPRSPCGPGVAVKTSPRGPVAQPGGQVVDLHLDAAQARQITVRQQGHLHDPHPRMRQDGTDGPHPAGLPRPPRRRGAADLGDAGARRRGGPPGRARGRHRRRRGAGLRRIHFGRAPG